MVSAIAAHLEALNSVNPDKLVVTHVDISGLSNAYLKIIAAITALEHLQQQDREFVMELKTELGKVQTLTADHAERITTVEKELKQMNTGILERVGRIESSLHDLSNQHIIFREQQEKKLEELTREVHVCTTNLKETKTDQKEMKKTLAEKIQEMGKIQAQVDKLQKQQDESKIEQKVAELSQQMESISKQTQNAISNSANLQDELATVFSQVKAASEEATNMQDKIGEIQKNHENNTDLINEEVLRREELERKVTGMDTTLQKTHNSVENMEREMEVLKETGSDKALNIVQEQLHIFDLKLEESNHAISELKIANAPLFQMEDRMANVVSVTEKLLDNYKKDRRWKKDIEQRVDSKMDKFIMGGGGGGGATTTVSPQAGSHTTRNYNTATSNKNNDIDVNEHPLVTIDKIQKKLTKFENDVQGRLNRHSSRLKAAEMDVEFCGNMLIAMRDHYAGAEAKCLSCAKISAPTNPPGPSTISGRSPVLVQSQDFLALGERHPSFPALQWKGMKPTSPSPMPPMSPEANTTATSLDTTWKTKLESDLPWSIRMAIMTTGTLPETNRHGSTSNKKVRSRSPSPTRTVYHHGRVSPIRGHTTVGHARSSSNGYISPTE